MKMVLSAIVTLSAVAAFANAPAKDAKAPTTTTTTAPAAATTTGAAATTATTTTTTETTTKEAKAGHGTTSKTMTKEDAEKACAKDANKDACVKKHTGAKM